MVARRSAGGRVVTGVPRAIAGAAAFGRYRPGALRAAAVGLAAGTTLQGAYCARGRSASSVCARKPMHRRHVAFLPRVSPSPLRTGAGSRRAERNTGSFPVNAVRAQDDFAFGRLGDGVWLAFAQELGRPAEGFAQQHAQREFAADLQAQGGGQSLSADPIGRCLINKQSIADRELPSGVRGQVPVSGCILFG